MYCPKCGEKKQDDTTVCSRCSFDFAEAFNLGGGKTQHESINSIKRTKRSLAIILAILLTGALLFSILNPLINTVDITLPATWYEDYDDLKLIEYARKEGYKKVVRNSDGSVTLSMSKKRHREKLAELSIIMDDAFDGLIRATETPYIKRIRQDKNYATITIDVEKEGYENTFFELTHLVVGMLASMYQRFTTDPQPVKIIIQDIGTGEVLLNYEP